MYEILRKKNSCLLFPAYMKETEIKNKFSLPFHPHHTIVSPNPGIKKLIYENSESTTSYGGASLSDEDYKKQKKTNFSRYSPSGSCMSTVGSAARTQRSFKIVEKTNDFFKNNIKEIQPFIDKYLLLFTDEIKLKYECIGNVAVTHFKLKKLTLGHRYVQTLYSLFRQLVFSSYNYLYFEYLKESYRLYKTFKKYRNELTLLMPLFVPPYCYEYHSYNPFNISSFYEKKEFYYLTGNICGAYKDLNILTNTFKNTQNYPSFVGFLRGLFTVVNFNTQNKLKITAETSYFDFVKFIIESTTQTLKNDEPNLNDRLFTSLKTYAKGNYGTLFFYEEKDTIPSYVSHKQVIKPSSTFFTTLIENLKK